MVYQQNHVCLWQRLHGFFLTLPPFSQYSVQFSLPISILPYQQAKLVSLLTKGIHSIQRGINDISFCYCAVVLKHKTSSLHKSKPNRNPSLLKASINFVPIILKFHFPETRKEGRNADVSILGSEQVCSLNIFDSKTSREGDTIFTSFRKLP